MAEGDTIHRTAARIGAAFAGGVPEEILAPHPRHRAERWPEKLAGRSLLAADAHGKHLFLRFEGGLTMHSHLRMSGAWSVQREGQRWPRARSRAWLVLRGRGNEAVQFNGPVLELLADARLRAHPALRGLGPDVLAESFDSHAFLARLRAADPRRTLGDALIDQRIVAGIGNVWKAEACFAAGIDPWRAVGALADEEALAIADLAGEGMRTCVEQGHAARPTAVYRRAGRPCRRCGQPVRSRGQGDENRITYWCGACQA